MSHIFQRTKHDLYVQYEKEITELVEGMEGAVELSEEERALQQMVPEHLRVSYSRQQLLCLRAAKVTPIQLRSQPDGGSEAADTENGGAPLLIEEGPQRTWPDTEVLEQQNFDAELEEKVVAQRRDIRNKSLHIRQMHRLQNESLQKLRQSILEMEAYRESREELMHGKRSEDQPLEGEEQSGVVDAAVHKENLAIMKDGGRQGRQFTDQRLAILDALDVQLQRERLADRLDTV